MVFHALSVLFVIAIKLILLGVGLLYLFRVLWTYHAEGLKAVPRHTWSDPARSADALAIWLGLKLVDGVWAGVRWAINVLEEASADVGEWFMGHRGAGS